MQKWREHKALLPLCLLLLLCQWTLLSVISGWVTWEFLDWGPLLQHLLAFPAAIACIAVYFLRRRYYVFVLPAVLLLGTFNVINFTPYEVIAYLRVFFVLQLQLQPLVAVIACIALAQVTMGSKKAGHAEEVYIDAEKLADFKDRYRSYDTGRLQAIVQENRYVAEALEAARQILQERVTTTEEPV